MLNMLNPSRFYLILHVSSQITKQGMSSRVVDEQNVEKQFTSSEIVSNSDNYEMIPIGPPPAGENDWKNVSHDSFTFELLTLFIPLLC